MPRYEISDDTDASVGELNSRFGVFARNPGGRKRHLSHTEIAAADGSLLSAGSSVKNPEENLIGDSGEKILFPKPEDDSTPPTTEQDS